LVRSLFLTLIKVFSANSFRSCRVVYETACGYRKRRSTDQKSDDSEEVFTCSPSPSLTDSDAELTVNYDTENNNIVGGGACIPRAVVTCAA